MVIRAFRTFLLLDHIGFPRLALEVFRLLLLLGCWIDEKLLRLFAVRPNISLLVSSLRGRGARAELAADDDGFTMTEVLLGEPYSYEVDAWSLGTMLYEMLAGLTYVRKKLAPAPGR